MKAKILKKVFLGIVLSILFMAIPNESKCQNADSLYIYDLMMSSNVGMRDSLGNVDSNVVVHIIYKINNIDSLAKVFLTIGTVKDASDFLNVSFTLIEEGGDKYMVNDVDNERYKMYKRSAHFIYRTHMTEMSKMKSLRVWARDKSGKDSGSEYILNL